jgi:membrane carboxypeptidase/penicillin-binding protein
MGTNKTGAVMALPIWADFMSKITDQKGDEPFPRPPGIVTKTICADSGMLATTKCDSLREEVFLPSNAPQKLCDLHGGLIHDFSGLAKDFETLDRKNEEIRDF